MTPAPPHPEKEGLKLKYFLTKVDGSPVDSDADYFILKLNSKTRWHREASIKAILAYADSVQPDAPLLAEDIIKKYGCASHTTTPSERDKVFELIADAIENQKDHKGFLLTCDQKDIVLDIVDAIEAELRTQTEAHR